MCLAKSRNNANEVIAFPSIDPPLWFGDRSAARHYCRGKVYSPDGLRDLRAVTLPFSMTNS